MLPNLGFFEITLFAIIALIVLGPEKLPEFARMLGRWYGNLRRMSTRLQSELVSELELMEVQEQLRQEIAKIKEAELAMKAQMDEMQQALNKTQQYAQNTVREIEQGGVSPSAIDDGGVYIYHSTPLTNHFFLLSDYDKKRRLPSPPFLPNYTADKLLYQSS